MPDIAMCPGQTEDGPCPKRETCYHFTATPNEFRQSWFMEAPLTNGNCDYQMPTWKPHATKTVETKVV